MKNANFMSNRLTVFVAASLLVFIFVVTVFSMKDDSLTMDELAHLPAGYAYLTQKDMRLNPEHPPLVKDLAAVPLLFIKGIRFPAEDTHWTNDVNGQWDFGHDFLFASGNPTEKMIFWARIPMILLLVFLGFLVFLFSRRLWGNKVALLSLFLFAFSPTFLAHGRLVTTDVGAAFGVWLATYFFLRFLRLGGAKSLLWAGLSLGIALLMKFSTILLLPYLALLVLIWAWISSVSARQKIISLFVWGLKFVGVLGLAALVIWLVYLYHVWNYPAGRQAKDTLIILWSFPFPVLRSFIAFLDLSSWFRPFSQYLLGLTMVLQRGASGNTTYFLGEVSAAGWKNYFPVVYAIKEPLAFFGLMILGAISAAFCLKKPFWQDPLGRLQSWLKQYFTEFSFLLFIAVYWLFTLSGNLNIGVRHLLPIFPFAIVLVSRATFLWLREPFFKLKVALLGFLLAWQVSSVLNVFPSFLAYFNELAGGPDNGYVYVVDSNLDWGQDLKRLNWWLEKNKIAKIYVDYFGGSDAKHYLGDKYLQWWSSRGQAKEMTESRYLAVSATFLQNERGLPVPGFKEQMGRYRWLDHEKLVAKIGYSIFVYEVRPP